MSSDSSLGTSFAHSFAYMEPQAVQWAQCMKQTHDVLLVPRSDETHVLSLKINKLSTYKLYTENRPGFTGCVLHAACKYLSLIIFQRLTATTALFSPLHSLFLPPELLLLLL